MRPGPLEIAGQVRFGRECAPKTVILPTNNFIEVSREKMKDAAMPKVFLGAGVFLFHHFSGKGNTAFAGFSGFILMN